MVKTKQDGESTALFGLRLTSWAWFGLRSRIADPVDDPGNMGWFEGSYEVVPWNMTYRPKEIYFDSSKYYTSYTSSAKCVGLNASRSNWPLNDKHCYHQFGYYCEFLQGLKTNTHILYEKSC